VAERRRRTRLLLEGGAALAVVIVFGLVYLHVVLAQRQFAIDHLTSQVQKEQARYQSLRLEVAQLGSPQNIIATAEGQLGMVQPASVTYLTPAHEIGAPADKPSSAGTGSAPAGDADWPQIKSQLAGSP
jgi:cell division protein FtsL